MGEIRVGSPGERWDGGRRIGRENIYESNNKGASHCS